MSNTLARSFSHTPSSQTKSSHKTMRKYIEHWIKSEPPYVNPKSKFHGIMQLSGIEELCQQSKPVINKYLRYFHRICVVKDFDKTNKIDIMVVAMGSNQQYKSPPKYVYLLLCVFVLYICLLLL